MPAIRIIQPIGATTALCYATKNSNAVKELQQGIFLQPSDNSSLQANQPVHRKSATPHHHIYITLIVSHNCSIVLP